MLYNHRIINGEIVGLQEYKYNNYKTALYSILNDDQKGKLEQYWQARYTNENFKEGKKDYLRDFLLTLPKSQQQEFIKQKQILDANAKEQFEKNPRFIDAFKLNNGIAELQEEIEIDGKKYNVKLNDKAFAEFKNKVVHVNQKNNGIYNKDDAATLSRRAIGKLALQFRKYMRPSWNKRFGSKFGKAYWNEQRKEWDKGSYISLLHFLGTPFKDISFNSEEANAVLNFIGSITNSIGKLATNSRIYWGTLDDFEKANIKRASRELGLLLATIVVGKILSSIKGGDDDEDESFGYDLLCYQTDRLMSELMFHTPLGMVNEGQKILKSPFAAQSALLDIAKFTGSAVAYPFQSDENRIYQTGMYRDEVKLKVNAFKLIPVLNKYQQLNRINKLIP